MLTAVGSNSGVNPSSEQKREEIRAMVNIGLDQVRGVRNGAGSMVREHVGG